MISHKFFVNTTTWVCMKMIAVTMAVLLWSSSALCQSPEVMSDRFTSVVAKVRPSIVAVGSYYFKDTPTVQYFGTGFAIDDGLTIVTNAHVD